ncbi:MAG: electron transport complex subunit RsxC [Suipraeoptans sp.]
MAIFTFKGGIHPSDGKDYAKDKAITELKPESDLVFPVSQHIGAPASPVVAKGDEVLRGQKIAEASGFVSAPIYSSVSGTVKNIEKRLTSTGMRVNSIVIENDGEYKEVEFSKTNDVSQLSKEDILKHISEAGIVGMGGAGFPTHVKLSPKEPDKIDYIIANCAECEPYITADYRRMLENGKELVEGLKIILKLFDNAKGIIAIEDNKPDCVKHLQELTKDDENIEVKALQTKYPQGGERHLIYATTKRAINSSMLPADAGCVVDNVETIINIYYAVAEGKPLMDRVTTVSGDAVNEPGNYKVMIGTNVQDLIIASGGFKEEPKKLISGGPMMGFSMYTLDAPITKTSSAILAFTKDEVEEHDPTPCINCGRCVEVCPGRVVPSRLADIAEHGDEESFLAHEGLECCECGCCSYVCPAKRPLKQSIASMRKQALANKKKEEVRT